MLIQFNIENFLSFKDRASISLIPGSGRQKPSHKTPKVRGVSVLKTSILFGANAAGKSNLVKAIRFGQRKILYGTKSEQPIIFERYKLDKKLKNRPSRIEYEIQHKGKNYAYGFVFTDEKIVEEWLYEFSKTTETKIFDRDISKPDSFDIEPIINKNKKKDEKQFLNFLAKGTPNNQLFLTEIRNRKVEENVSNIQDLQNVIDWFQNALHVILPDDKYNDGVKFEVKDNNRLQTIFEELLNYFDTGVNGICLEEVDPENVEFPKQLLSQIKAEIFTEKSSSIILSVVSSRNTRYYISNKEGKIGIHKFMTKHNLKNSDDQEHFDTSEESDGTNRIIDFIPLIIDLLNGNKVFIIDEIERSLHPNLIYDLFDLFLERADNVNSQLITACHESSLLTQKLLRKDEIWFIVKDEFGASHIHSLEEYNVRFDKEIRKDYLLGRFKAIPRLGNRNILTVLPPN